MVGDLGITNSKLQTRHVPAVPGAAFPRLALSGRHPLDLPPSLRRGKS